ncbi:SoxR reducing system RseC family protein [uncultured Parabacteroides sp.]|uniref:SoxR reducing system RseC family protein n=1 Tax=uncultured Parabacteroides sp. TaxID=512312 RepID=UPI0026313CF1|nr:SoxR reducing system RseC family protein [uncultured Parabacteroides sp.]
MSESINHTGFVEKIDGDTVFVRITQQSACSGCHAQSICSASEKKDKIIEVPDRSGRFRVNEEVMVCGQNSMGLQAVALAFVIPLAIVVAAIVIGTNLHWNETTSGLTGLLLLLPYYCILYLMRDKLKRRFIFTLKKLN